jgi:hypothetical protein
VSTALCAGVGIDGKIIFNTFALSQTAKGANGTWSGWKAVNPVSTLASDPRCAGPNVYDTANEFSVCAARTTGGKMAVYLYDAVGFEGEVVLPAYIASTPSCATDLLWNGDGTLAGFAGTAWTVVCVARTPNGALALAQYDYGYVDPSGHSVRQAPWRAGSWAVSVTTPPDGPVYSPVSCTEFNNNGGWCAWLTGGNQVSGAFIVPKNTTNYSQPDYTWGAPIDLGGTLVRPPDCTFDHTYGNAGVTCFGIGENSSLYGNVYYIDNSNEYHWTGWLGGIGGLVEGSTCVDFGFGSEGGSGGPGFVFCGATSLSGAGFWTNVLDHGGWSGWTRQGTGIYVGTPSCFEVLGQSGEAMCVVHSADGTTASIIPPGEN